MLQCIMTFSKFGIYFQVISNCHLKIGINLFRTPCIIQAEHYAYMNLGLAENATKCLTLHAFYAVEGRNELHHMILLNISLSVMQIACKKIQFLDLSAIFFGFWMDLKT